MTTVHHVPVLIVGGGLVGLSAALFLEYHAVPYLLVERREQASVLPRSRGVHTRTVELFRQVGLERRIQQLAATALKVGAFGGASRGATLRTATPLNLDGLHRVLASAEPSPSQFCFAPQVLLEPLLAAAARERGGDLRFGAELVAFGANDEGVTATLRDRSGESILRADYLLAADGAGSSIRRALGIAGWDLPPTHHYINAFVRVDLTEVLGGRTFSQCEIRNDDVRCLVLSKNNTDEWSFHLEFDPTVETLADYLDDRCAALIRAAIGVPDIPVRVLAKTAWDTGVFIADEYRRGRVFLVGDAAHRHAPWGGYGANTGIADAHNLVWKLAAVLSGVGGDELLDSYQDERRPRALIAAEQARLGTDFATRYGLPTADNVGDLARQMDFGTVMSRYRYCSNAVIGGESASHVETLTGQVGTRLPHLWIDADEQVSTLDLAGPGFAILVAGTAEVWHVAAAESQRDHGFELTVDALPADLWCARTGLPEGGALIVRPDGVVAARSDAGLSPASLTAVVRTLTGRTKADIRAAASA
ncbi:FAD-dependent monooxygenase [Nocardia sp. 2YAB30]|uniref:FAD-dependent monooxygenase n=1 Tax=unclassified Nocardia TaxID=2637762 RepID=UPI003F9DAC39